ncbi:3-oxoacyl-[acyl-carrier-protein] reductase [Desulfosporosinus sp. BICA1-9]|uniref:3-oxoacyl-[acyl-carrier-protein] reductase n=1 Tax=Desulfosporosinus sp. BICA1-9 TaxID=1531958 RepID=UPI00054B9773|nr:3-oxoacyl-[acyl-carrier-protein] reductase [Desulfosporosinus sp. BICA1-9]KJS48673.1 MAG: 3-oxoacyl-ACP reductase [Peptococcaceae bacterium BRH_c23]KJS90508.1 MAG: 3-oxoacyl-ACP reductase [Desulfosporosinus sp. BICA1-9]HBW36961.1 3-oxoacyl-[acyl-carrier-protein] reductase [Desulfosporosinus sp.]
MVLNDSVAIVTGSGRGIGRAIALELATAGVKIVVNYAGRADKAEETLSLIREAGGEGLAVQADVSQAAEVDRLLKTTLDHFGKVDILVNNAGITRDSLLLRMKEADWDSVLATNLKGAYLCTKAVSKGMLKQRSGVIVNISSVVGLSGNAGQANYAAAKAGMIGFTKSIAKEFASRGIRVNAVAPGYIFTDMTETLPEGMQSDILRGIPLGRMGKPEDVAKVVRFLVSPEASYITGQTLCVDGGMEM